MFMISQNHGVIDNSINDEIIAWLREEVVFPVSFVGADDVITISENPKPENASGYSFPCFQVFRAEKVSEKEGFEFIVTLADSYNIIRKINFMVDPTKAILDHLIDHDAPLEIKRKHYFAYKKLVVDNEKVVILSA